MGKPAARLGDTTAHGGSIVAGAPTVMIGGMPAARMNDMHVCPMLNPGTPPPPHVGGPILMGCPTVMICGMAAACVGDTCQCSGPPDSIVMGCFTVMIGGGGGGGGGAGSGSTASAEASGQAGEEVEGHYLNVSFVDKGGFPVTGVQYSVKDPDNKISHGKLTGKVKKTGVKEGSYEISIKAITGVKWSVDEARTGEKVKMQAETKGFESNDKATFEVWQKDINKADKLIATFRDIDLSGDKAEAEWTYQYEPEEGQQQGKKGYSSPTFYFSVKISECLQRSGILRLEDYFEIELVDENGDGVAKQEYIFYLPNGDVRRGTLDDKGYKKEENVPPGQCRVEFPGRSQTNESR